MLIAVTVLSPGVSGYSVSIITGAHGPTAFFEAGATRVEVPFVLHEALAGLIPFLALMMASPGQGLVLWARRSAVGIGIIYVAHVAVLILSPLLVTPHAWWVNRIIDVTYGFYAVAGFVGLPFSLWVILTRPWIGLPGGGAPAEGEASTAATRPERISSRRPGSKRGR